VEALGAGDLLPADRKPTVVSITLSPAAGNAVPVSPEAWADAESLGGDAMDPDVAAQWCIPAVEAMAPPQPSSQASSESGWEMPQAVIPQRQAPAGKRSRAPSSVASSKASRVSSVLDNISGFRKKQTPP